MENNLLIFLLLTLTLITATTQIILFIYLTGKNRKSGPAEDFPDATEEKNAEILHDAILKANKILVNAELKGIEYISKRKLDSEKFFGDYQSQISHLEEKLLKQFDQTLAKMDQSFAVYMSGLEKKLLTEEEANRKLFQEKTLKLMENSQTLMQAFINEINGKIKSQIEDELTGVKNEIYNYKKKRLEIINSNIVDILEQTLEQALGKKLSLADYSEIIFTSLEQAKNEHSLM